VNCPVAAGNFHRLVPANILLSSEKARIDAIEAYGIIDLKAESSFDDLAALAARICNLPMAAISFVTDARQSFKAAVGFEIHEQPVDDLFCAQAIKQQDLFVVEDASAHEIFKDNPLVTGNMNVRFYAGIPIRSHDGIALGTLCVFGQSPKPGGLSLLEGETLKVLARQIESQLELRRAIKEHHRINEREFLLPARLDWITNHDLLTKLPNRTLFQQHLKTAIALSKEKQKSSVVMLVDVDHFKQVNDNHGHDVGDALLCAFAARLDAIIGMRGTVARIGGDEFAVILPCLSRESELDVFVTAMLKSLREPFEHKNRFFECRASIGISTYPDQADTLEEMVKNADLALADAKLSGRNCASMFRSSLASKFQLGNAMLDRARYAIERHLIHPFYQPKLSFESGQIRGFEALLRWQNNSGEIELPGAIASAFDDQEIAVSITNRMIERILTDMRTWNETGVPFNHIAINTSAADFASNDFAERLLERLADFAVLPTMIEIEVTESVVLSRGGKQVHRALSLLREKGVRIALDDFGTGYASLANLKQLPITTLKIDKSFVSGLGKNIDDEAIVAAMTTLGRTLGIETVAEGVETWEQAEKLAQMGATMGQGFVFSPAVSGERVPYFLARDSSPLCKTAPLSISRHKFITTGSILQPAVTLSPIVGDEHLQSSGTEYFSELIVKSNVDQINIILGNGITDVAKRRYAVCDWLDRWESGSRERANSALKKCLAEGWSRSKLCTLDNGTERKWHDVVLNRSRDRSAVVSVARDVTEDTNAQERLRRAAFEDGLTGLSNRFALRDKLAFEIERLAGTEGSIAVFMVDLDNFKFINDTWGHNAGDTLLIEAARRLKRKLPKSATLARLGGDEFVIIVSAAKGRPDVFAIAEKLLVSMRQPVEYRGRTITTQASIGVALFPAHGTSQSELLKNADIALYTAKAFGRGGFSTYVPSMGSSLRKRASAIEAVRDALKHHRIGACYQPKVELGSKCIMGFEAIPKLRFENGLPIPQAVIRNAMDDIDVARQIGDSMFERVADDVKVWLAAGMKVENIALNTSAADFRAGDFTAKFLERLHRMQLPAELFEIEISETVLAGRNTDYVTTALSDLTDAGIRVTLDDFGTGVSSIVQLKHMPFDSVKIDQSIISSLETDNRDEAIVKALIGFADGLGFRTAALGIQSSSQLETLRSMGCRIGQGDFWGQPIAASDMFAGAATA
jgi:diguanylate cyclase (GGDEF)-like protein